MIELARSKTNQRGDIDEIVVLPRGTLPRRCPVTAVQTWLDAASITDGPLFRAVSNGNRALDRRLSAVAVNKIIQTAVVRGGLVDDGGDGGYSAHSLRAGFVTYAHARGASDRAIAHQTRHRSLAHWAATSESTQPGTTTPPPNWDSDRVSDSTVWDWRHALIIAQPASNGGEVLRCGPSEPPGTAPMGSPALPSSRVAEDPRGRVGGQKVPVRNKLIRSTGVFFAVLLLGGCSPGGEDAEPQACGAERGSVTDIGSEPDWRRHAEYRPWTDTEGCLLRIDIVAERPGSEHCGWEEADVVIWCSARPAVHDPG